MSRRRSRYGPWLSGLAVGAGAGLATLVVPTLGWLLILAFLVPALLLRGSRLSAVGGLLFGLGVVWLLLLGRMALACSVSDPNELGCHAPDMGPWLTTGGVMLGAGMLLTVLAIGRSRRA